MRFVRLNQSELMGERMKDSVDRGAWRTNLNACWPRGVVELAFTEGKTMATYVYETIPKDPKKKPRQFEVQQKMSDPPLTKDPETGEPVRRVITGGSGWVTHGASILSMNTRKGRR